MKKVRILLVDDFKPFREFVMAALTDRPEYEVIGETGDGFDAVDVAIRKRPDLVLLDIGLPTICGLETAKMIKELVPGTKILFVSEYSSHDFIDSAFRVGASGYVVKYSLGEHLLPAIEAVSDGKTFGRGQQIGPSAPL